MIVALHGFLGLDTDWSEPLEDIGHTAMDLWADALGIIEGGEQGRAFDAWVEMFTESLQWMELEAKPILLGYSLGGRLAMHAAIARPDLFRGAVFVSAHPGLSTEEERAARKASDADWAKRFASEEPWNELLKAWNGQAVFQSAARGTQAAGGNVIHLFGNGSIELARDEEDFDRDVLAHALKMWSLAKQRDLRAELAKLPIPVLYMSGSEDKKFSTLLEGLQLGPRQKREVIEGAGHRVPWDRPREFRASLERFIDHL